ncbi:hypothetical protein CYMTET_49864 [Cymbomonas tetramitiformis]|uniref:Uncharacterized protein n=1 Tax=Cymbomonas tetramitiformis TaxID=36881 RepID=A0AAE0BR07_9CHLO|nr:hypothetical protein CYMTET_49864 [Cymbomonas tetramitiformis]
MTVRDSRSRASTSAGLRRDRDAQVLKPVWIAERRSEREKATEGLNERSAEKRVKRRVRSSRESWGMKEMNEGSAMERRGMKDLARLRLEMTERSRGGLYCQWMGREEREERVMRWKGELDGVEFHEGREEGRMIKVHYRIQGVRHKGRQSGRRVEEEVPQVNIERSVPKGIERTRMMKGGGKRDTVQDKVNGRRGGGARGKSEADEKAIGGVGEVGEAKEREEGRPARCEEG